jgi:hypothetical protein
LISLVSQLEAQQKALRSELLTLRSSGAKQETDSPYLLAFVDQELRTVDWRTHALDLAAKLYGIEKATTWKLEVEASAPTQQITQIRVKPNPTFAAGLTKPVASLRIPLTPRATGKAVRFGE